jgi:hypothetical protein
MEGWGRDEPSNKPQSSRSGIRSHPPHSHLPRWLWRGIREGTRGGGRWLWGSRFACGSALEPSSHTSERGVDEICFVGILQAAILLRVARRVGLCDVVRKLSMCKGGDDEGEQRGDGREDHDG